MNFEFSKNFEKSLDKVKNQKLRNALSDAVSNVNEAKNIGEIKNLKKLSGYKTAFRIKIGDYRIGIVYKDNTIYFIDFDHRKDIYNNFP